MCGKIMTVLLIFVVLNCSMARYNGRLHCIVGGLTHLLQAQSSHLFLPSGWHGAIGFLDDLISNHASFFWWNFSVELESFLKEIFKNFNNVYSYLMSI